MPRNIASNMLPSRAITAPPLPAWLEYSTVNDHRGSRYTVIIDRQDSDNSREFKYGRFREDWFERRFTHACMSVPCKSSVVLDVGANVGTHTMFLARHLARQVWAFEPQRQIFQRLVTHTLLNGLTNVWPLNVALAHQQKPMQMIKEQTDSSKKLVDRTEEDVLDLDGVDTEIVMALSLDEVWSAQGKPRVALVKVDVDGNEISMLKGANKMLQTMRPIIFYQDRVPANLTTIFLQTVGYCPQLMKSNVWLKWEFVAKPCRSVHADGAEVYY
mmetsp:Transcript_45556/g.75413  ORF Transcript_45556/g.75413 Transcript_45556/m.75413 type:complete len:272 (+) Transcript_45556:60-875(+)